MAQKVRILIGFLLCLVICLWIPAGTITIDEGAYYLATKSLVEYLSISLNNGSPEFGSAFEIHGKAPLIVWVKGKLYSVYPIGHSLFSAPFYSVLGFKGLYLVNILSVAIIILLVSRLTKVETKLSTLLLIPTLILSALSIWPHALNTALIFGAYYLLFRGEDSSRKETLIASALLGLSLLVRYDSVLGIVGVIIILLIKRSYFRFGAVSIIVSFFVLSLCIINYLKFGSFIPFIYGSGSLGAVYRHGVFGLCILLVIAASSLVFPRITRLFYNSRRKVLVAFCFVILFFILPDWTQNLYSTLFHFNPRESPRLPLWYPFLGADNQEVFSTFKLALFQFSPHLVLGISVLWIKNFELKKKIQLVIIPILYLLFYGLRGWHGGLSLEMRYLYPIVPFFVLAVLEVLKTYQYRLSHRDALLCLLLGLIVSLFLPLTEVLLLDLTTIIALCILLLSILGRFSKILFSFALVLSLSTGLFQAMNIFEARSRSEHQTTTLVQEMRNNLGLIVTNHADIYFPIKEYAEVDIARLNILDDLDSASLLYHEIFLCCSELSNKTQCMKHIKGHESQITDSCYKVW